MFPTTPRYGTVNISQPVNALTGKPTTHAWNAVYCPGYLDSLTFTNYAVRPMYVMVYDQSPLPPQNVVPTDPNYIKPKMIITINPAVSSTVPTTTSFDINYLIDKLNYTDQRDFFKQAITFAYSTDPSIFKGNPGAYAVKVVGAISIGQYKGFDPLHHLINIGQGSEGDPSVGYDVTVGGPIDTLCKNVYNDGWRKVRWNYVSAAYSGFSYWKNAAVFVNQKFPNSQIGITSKNGPSTTFTKANFDAHIAALNAWVAFCVANNIKSIGLGNEEGNSLPTSQWVADGVADPITYIFQKLAAKSIELAPTLPGDFEFTISISQGEVNKAAAALKANPHAFNRVGLNAYDTATLMSSHIIDAKAKFQKAGITNLFVTECGKDYGINDPIYGGSPVNGSTPAVAGDEHLQAVDYVQRRNVNDSLNVDTTWFCYNDHGVGGGTPYRDQFGLVKMDGTRREAYTAILAS